MFKKLTLSAVGLLLLVSPLVSSAQTTSAVQAQIDALLKQITQLQALITQLKSVQSTTQTDGTQEAGHEALPCIVLTRALTIGSTDVATGGEVSKLQNFLMGQGTADNPIYPERLATGYFGPATSRAVQKWQTLHGIPITTIGGGVVGPMTRAAMASCARTSTNAQTTQNTLTLQAAPSSGYAPLAVSFSGPGNISGMSYGDGTSCSDNAPDAPTSLSCRVSGGGLKPHAYTKPGTYQVIATKSLPSGRVGEVTITVLGDVATTATTYTSASFDATPMSGSAPLTVNFKGQINVPSSYSGSAIIFFGDGVSDVMFRSGSTLFNESWTHAYSQSGEYDAYLILSSVSNVDSDIEVMRNPNYYKNTVVKKIHISVGGQSDAPSIVVKGVSGNNLHVQFTNMPEFLFDIVAEGTNVVAASNLGPSVNAGTAEALVPIPSTVPSGNYFLRVRATSNGAVLANSAPFYITGTWATYTNNAYNYTIQYPTGEGWVYGENGVGVGFGTPASISGGYIYGVAAYDKNVVSLSTLIARMGDQFSDRQESRQNITINGVPALLVTVSTNQVSGWVSKAVYVEYGNRIYTITNGATNRTDFETFYQSFKIKG